MTSSSRNCTINATYVRYFVQLFTWKLLFTVDISNILIQDPLTQRFVSMIINTHISGSLLRVSSRRSVLFYRALSSLPNSACQCGGPYCGRSTTTPFLPIKRCDFSTSGDLSIVGSNVQQLLLNNRNWVKEKKLKDPNFFTKLVEIHKPKYLYIGCSDSRLPVHQILGLE